MSTPRGGSEVLADGGSWRTFGWKLKFDKGWGCRWTSLLAAPQLRQAFDRRRSLRAAALSLEGPSLSMMMMHSFGCRAR